MTSIYSEKIFGLYLLVVLTTGISSVTYAEPVTCKFQFGREHEACLELQRCRGDCSKSNDQCLRQISSTREQAKYSCEETFKTEAVSCRKSILCRPSNCRSNVELQACLTSADTRKISCVAEISGRWKIEWQERSPKCFTAVAKCHQQCDDERKKAGISR